MQSTCHLLPERLEPGLIQRGRRTWRHAQRDAFAFPDAAVTAAGVARRRAVACALAVRACHHLCAKPGNSVCVKSPHLGPHHITRIKYPHCGVRSLKWRSTSACRLPQAAPFQTDGRDAIAVRPQLSALAIECVFAYNEQQKRSCDTLHTALSCAGSTVWVWPSQQAPQRWFDTRVGWGVHLLEHTQGCADCLNHLA